jgi:hypothetical protein
MCDEQRRRRIADSVAQSRSVPFDAGAVPAITHVRAVAFFTVAITGAGFATFALHVDRQRRRVESRQRGARGARSRHGCEER